MRPAAQCLDIDFPPGTVDVVNTPWLSIEGMSGENEGRSQELSGSAFFGFMLTPAPKLDGVRCRAKAVAMFMRAGYGEEILPTLAAPDGAIRRHLPGRANCRVTVTSIELVAFHGACR